MTRIALSRSGAVREPDRRDRRQAGDLEVAQDLELAVGDSQRLLLERVRPAVDDQEPDEVARRADRQVAELERVGRPVGERQLPRQVEQGRRRRRAAGGAGTARAGASAGQSFLRR